MKKDSKKSIKVAFAAVTAFALTLSPLMMGCSSGQSSQSSASSSASSAAVSSQSSSSAAAAAEGDITVTVTLTESVAGSSLQETALQFSEETLTVNAMEGATALEVLNATGREVETEDATEVISIGGLSNGDAGEGSHWTYEVNGEAQTMPPSEYVMQNGDQLTFIFVA